MDKLDSNCMTKECIFNCYYVDSEGRPSEEWLKLIKKINGQLENEWHQEW